MMKMLRRLSIVFLLLSVVSVTAVSQELNVNKEIGELIVKNASEVDGSGNNTVGKRISAAALSLVGTDCCTKTDSTAFSYVAGPEKRDLLSLVNLCMAAQKTVDESYGRLYEFDKNYAGLSCRKGEYSGFASRLLYSSEWITDNIYRGNVKELTENYTDGSTFRTKSLDFISHNKEQFPELADSAVFEKVKMIEMGLRTYRVPHLKKQNINRRNVGGEMQSGDILVMLSPQSDKDTFECGIVVDSEEGYDLVYIDTNTCRVEKVPVNTYFKKKGQNFYGYRWLRPQ